jgi:hypothetical protein
MQAYDDVIELVLTGAVRKATKYISPTRVVTATARHRPDKRRNTVELVLTVGKPNCAGKKFIKSAIKAGEPFPIRKIQLRFWGK